MVPHKTERNTTVPLDVPELTLGVVLFFLHFVWEMLQTPFFAEMPFRPHWPATLFCLSATLGDVVAGVFAFGCAALLAHHRFWFLAPSRLMISVYLGVGLLLTVALELHAIHIAGRWAYSPLMPTIPGLAIGLIPVLQWILIPLSALAVLRRLYADVATH